MGRLSYYSEVPVCPRCWGFIPNNESPGAYPGALSRVAADLEICSDCGTEEAINDFKGIANDLRVWPVISARKRIPGERIQVRREDPLDAILTNPESSMEQVE